MVLILNSCNQCGKEISLSDVYRWVNGGIGELECRHCGSSLVGCGALLTIYTLFSVMLVGEINYSTDITQLLLGYGIQISKIWFVISSIFKNVFMIYCAAIIIVLIRSI